MVSWTVVFAIGAAQAALLALALWRRPVNAGANRVLAAWIALVALDLAVKAAHWDPSSSWAQKALQFVGLFPFLYGSLFYGYVRVLTETRTVRCGDSVHLAGFAIVVMLHAGIFIGDLIPAQSALAQWLPSGTELRRWRLDVVLYAYSLAYVVAALAQVVRYRRRLQQRSSEGDRTSLRWIDAMAASQMAIWLIAILHWQVSIPFIDYALIYGLVVAWIFVMGYLSLVQAAVVAVPAPSPPPAAMEAAQAADDPRSADVEARLLRLMAEHHLYREPAITIGQLAKRCGYPEYLVSAVINRRFGENFWEYINRQRVEAAARHLADGGDARTILDIAYGCGFTSKSTFNAAFKRTTGETPSAFRKRHVVREAPESASA